MQPAQRLLMVLLLFVSLKGLAQKNDSTKVIQHFSGTASVTDNGISLIPSFSLQRPAVIFILSLGGERFSVDPDIRFSLDGKPWTFLFWGRYKLIPKRRLRLTTGVHLGLNFRTGLLQTNGTPTEASVARRYLAGELSPSYALTKNITVGAYYLYSHGLDPGTVGNTHFITLNTTFSRLPISTNYYLRLTAQAYRLVQDATSGQFVTGTLSLARARFPLSVAYTINQRIQANIPASQPYIGSFSLVYSFNQNYVPKPPAAL